MVAGVRRNDELLPVVRTPYLGPKDRNLVKAKPASIDERFFREDPEASTAFYED